MKDKEMKDSILEETTKNLVNDIVNDVKNQMFTKDNELESYLLGLELLANLYNALKTWDIDRIAGIEYCYKNSDIFEVEQYLSK